MTGEAARRADPEALHRPAVPPLGSDARRPQWSVMIPTYNCGRFLEQSLRSVLEQDPGPDRMHIEVVDDHSTSDDPQGVVRRLAGDRVQFHRQPRNLGVPGNLNDSIRRSRGMLVHLLHGDDFVLPGYYEQMTRAFAADANIGAAFCRSVHVDETGHWRRISVLDPPASGVLPDAPRFMGSQQRVTTPSIVVRRSAYEELGGFDTRLACAEDWEMWMRIASRYAIYYEQQPLACYRRHSDSNTGRNVGTADDLEYTRRAIELFARYFDSGVAADIRTAALPAYARTALARARELRDAGDHRSMLAHLRVAWRFSRSPRVLAGIARVAVGDVPRRAWRRAAASGGRP